MLIRESERGRISLETIGKNGLAEVKRVEEENIGGGKGGKKIAAGKSEAWYYRPLLQTRCSGT